MAALSPSYEQARPRLFVQRASLLTLALSAWDEVVCMLSGVIARLGECGECLMARFAWKPLALHSRCIDPWMQGFTKPVRLMMPTAPPLRLGAFRRRRHRRLRD